MLVDGIWDCAFWVVAGPMENIGLCYGIWKILYMLSLLYGINILLYQGFVWSGASLQSTYWLFFGETF